MLLLMLPCWFVVVVVVVFFLFFVSNHMVFFKSSFAESDEREREREKKVGRHEVCKKMNSKPFLSQVSLSKIFGVFFLFQVS